MDSVYNFVKQAAVQKKAFKLPPQLIQKLQDILHKTETTAKQFGRKAKDTMSEVGGKAYDKAKNTVSAVGQNMKDNSKLYAGIGGATAATTGIAGLLYKLLKED